MTTDDKKERFDQLGLPPMELAESSVNSRNNNGVYKCLCPVFQKVMIMLFLTIFGAGTYVLLAKILENYGHPRNTQIILIKDNNEPPSMIRFIQLFNTTMEDVNDLTRKKRDIDSLQTNNMDAFNNINVNDGLLQKAREIIMKHDITCSDEDQEGICKDLVTKLRELTENNDFKNQKEETSNILIKVNNVDDSNSANPFESSTTDVTKREVMPVVHMDNIIENLPVQLKNISKYSYPHSSPHEHPFTDNCLMNLMKRYPQVKDYSYLTSEDLPHRESHYDHPLPLHPRIFLPAVHSSFKQTRNIDVPRRKMHQQDIAILLSFLTPKPEVAATERPSNSTREVSCPAGTKACLSGDACVEEKQWCDGNVDCDDVSDEARCSCKSRVDKSRLCDGYFDCPFGEDELGCYGCSENTFSCEDLDINLQSTCFSKEQRCNNIADCPNHKDEVECNMLAPSLFKKPIFAISNTEGFLHRNFKGEWYAVCKNPYMWAHDACRRETGLIIRPPYIQTVPIDPMIKVNYINTDSDGLQTSEECLNSSAVYVNCPDLLCGTRVQSTPQLLRENIALENHLFGRNKRFLQTNHPYPLMFYGYRQKRNVDNWDTNTNYGINFDTLKTEEPFDKMRNKRTESRVVGGKPSQPGAWPWLVAVYRNGMFHCGGVVITHSWIISAAHCVHKFWDHYYEIQVGMLRRFSFSPQEQSHKVTHVIVNQHYSQTDMQNDLSLLKVQPAIQFSRWVRPICLPSPDTAGPNWLWAPSPGTVCTAVGWGATAEHGPDPDHMREVELPIWEKCKHREDRAGKEICAGLKDGGKDACQGDSGGPLLCRNPLNSQQWYMAGIVSHGDGCGRKGEPGVYTRVSLFVKWIRYHTGSNTLPIIQPLQECPGFKCESGISKCLPTKRKCDRVVDCLDGDDEINCNFKRTIPTFFSTPKPTILEDIFSAKEVQESSGSYNETPTTIFPLDTTSFTTEPEIITSTESKDIKSQETEKVQTNKKDIEKPDFEHASTIEISIPTSEENLKFSEEQVTSDPVSLSTKEFVSSERGDAETFTVEISRKKIESGSSVLERLKELTTVRDLDDYQEISEQISETPTSIFTQQDFFNLQNIESTTQMNFQENSTFSILTTYKPEESLHQVNANKKIDDDIIERDQNPHLDVLDQIGTETEHVMEKKSSNKNDNLVTKSSDLDDKIEEIVISESQPAILGRKRHIPKEFQCRRINQIVPHHHRCDRKADCEDGTDELDCSCSDYLATFDNQLICDGVYDCADGHDESSCYSCGENQFLCKQSQMCLPLKNICDGRPHCPQGEDELDCFALSNGKEMEFNLDERPTIHLEGYLTKKHLNDWHVICDDKLTLEQQEQAATHICRYLGFSSANKFYVKYINLKEDEITKRSMDIKRIKRDVIERIPIHFAYRQTNEDNDTARNIVIHDVQIIKEQCVPNITKTCKSLYVVCDHSLFTDFDEIQNIYLRNTEAMTQIWPWIAKIFVEGEYKCTGVLVDLSWVLVSESCLWYTMFSQHYITAVLGSYRTLDTGNGIHEQVYQIDAKKGIYRNKIILLHLKQPAHYSNVVKPMIVSSSYPYLDSTSTCVAIGEDNKNHTLNVILEETSDNCSPSNRCFVRKSTGNICPPNISSNRHWAGIISCHTDQGWFPVASFVDSRGECGLDHLIKATDIDNLKNEINHLNHKKTLSSLVAKKSIDDCEGIRCSRGRCVTLAHTCDGVRDCEDGNDESESACVKKNNLCSTDLYRRGCECSSGQMKCRNGKCISKELFRDGNNDCEDGTDEPGQSTCLHYLARVMPSRLCDGILHCDDRSDEDPMYCKCFAKKTYKCGSKLNVDQCVALDMVCDGIRDCPEGEDEKTCIGLNAPPGSPHGTGQVIVRSHGVWYSKCYPKQNHTKSELEVICAELGFISGHAKQIHDIDKFTTHPHNSFVIDSFNDITLNNNTIIKMRNTHEPIAAAIFDEQLENCHPVFIECL